MAMLSLPWGRLHYEDAGGTGRPLVLLHGTGCDAADWAGVLAGLPAGLRPIRIEFRGHGRSAVPPKPFTLADLAADVLATIEALALDRPLLVGHSLGGMVAMEAARRTDRVAGLVLLEGWTRLAAAGAFSEGRFYGALDAGAIERIREKCLQTRARFAPAIWDPFWRSVAAFDGLAFLETAVIPVVEVYGALGRQATTEAGLMIPANPRIDILWVAGTGHYLPHEQPVAVAAACASLAHRTARQTPAGPPPFLEAPHFACQGDRGNA